jgi:hypothetical protein
MYLSKGISGLTDIKAVVLKPDSSVAGMFPLVELPGSFIGCYYYDYMSGTGDVEGSYFSRVVSPTENATDIVRFLLTKPTSGGDNTQSLSPNRLVAYIMNSQVDARVLETDVSEAFIDRARLRADFGHNSELIANVRDEVSLAEMSSSETIIVPRYC